MADLAKWALTSEANARDYLLKVTTDKEPVLRLLINAVSAAIERYTFRKLVSRRYLITGGDAPAFRLDGGIHGDLKSPSRLTLPEWPVTSFTSASYLMGDSSGTTVALNIGQAKIAPGGVIELVLDFFPRGFQNIIVEATCGYLAGTHDADLAVLEMACLRWLQVVWIDYAQGVGRGTNFSVGGSTVNLAQNPIPPDVAAMLDPYVRIL